jgi:hypothetical protein
MLLSQAPHTVLVFKLINYLNVKVLGMCNVTMEAVFSALDKLTSNAHL